VAYYIFGPLEHNKLKVGLHEEREEHEEHTSKITRWAMIGLLMTAHTWIDRCVTRLVFI